MPRLIGQDIKGMKIAVPNYFMSDIVEENIRIKIEETIEMLKDKGATVDYVDVKYLENAVTLYQNRAVYRLRLRRKYYRE